MAAPIFNISCQSPCTTAQRHQIFYAKSFFGLILHKNPLYIYGSGFPYVLGHLQTDSISICSRICQSGRSPSSFTICWQYVAFVQSALSASFKFVKELHAVCMYKCTCGNVWLCKQQSSFVFLFFKQGKTLLFLFKIKNRHLKDISFKPNI